MSRSAAFLALLLATGVSAMAAPITYYTTLDGPSESPANASPGTGFAWVIIDTVSHQMSVEASFSGLTGATTNAHIHCCTAAPGSGTAAVATTTPTFPGFPTGVTAGTYGPIIFDLSLAGSWNPTFITSNGGTPASAEAALAVGLASGSAYFNIHSAIFPGGEIRGFLQPVPEPGSMALVAAGLGALALRRRRRTAE